jgi:hypothetical protein
MFAGPCSCQDNILPPVFFSKNDKKHSLNSNGRMHGENLLFEWASKHSSKIGMKSSSQIYISQQHHITKGLLVRFVIISSRNVSKQLVCTRRSHFLFDSFDQRYRQVRISRQERSWPNIGSLCLWLRRDNSSLIGKDKSFGYWHNQATTMNSTRIEFQEFLN